MLEGDKVRVEGAATILSVSVRKVYLLVRDGRLTLYRDALTRRTWFLRDEVERLAAGALRPAGS